MSRTRVMPLLVVALFGLLTATAFAAPHVVCGQVGQSSETVIPGVTLTWDSSFLCENAPDEGTYEISVRVENSASSAEAVRVDALRLMRTTPRAWRQAPYATARASGLPIVIAPGETRSFNVTGDYRLIMTDEGKKANLHLQAAGRGETSSEPFKLGINVHLRGPGAVE